MRAIIVFLLLAGGIVAAVVLWPDSTLEDGVELVWFSDESTETVSFAGAFPGEDQEALANPLALATDGEVVYVAESDAGVIRVYSLNGGSRGEITIGPAEGSDSVYPVDVALVDEATLAVVDTTGGRVVLVRTDTDAADAVFAQVGAEDPATAPDQPSAVAVVGGRLLVADGDAGVLRRYDLSGRYLDEVVLDFEPEVGVIAALCECGGRLFVSDSTSGRVLIVDAETGELRRVLDKLMDLPRGVVADGIGTTYVADRFGPAVEVFDGDGNHAESFGDGSRTGVGLAMPVDVAWVMATSRVYVLDAAAGRVAVFNVRSVDEAGR